MEIPDNNLDPGGLRFWLNVLLQHTRTRGIRNASLVSLRFCRNSFHKWLWDIRHKVETRKRVPVWRLGIGGLSAAEYSSYYDTINAESLETLLDAMALRWERFIFVDLGSGKGKALLIAARRPFARVVGIELSPILVDISRRNIANYRPVPLACFNIEVLRADAAGFEFPDQPLVIYCNNPFRREIMQVVLTNLERSLREHPRELFLVYIVPAMHDLICRSGFLKVLETGKDYCLYGTDNIAGGGSSTKSRVSNLFLGPASCV